MRTLHYLLVGAVALFAFVSCADKDVPYIPKETEYDEAWYAANATISSSDAHFSYTEEGEGAIYFKAEGGSVVVYVDCGTEWTADDSEAGVFGCEVQETCITVTADQNLVEEELYGTITLMTSASKIRFATIAVTQNARACITLSAEEFEFGKMGGEAEVTVESNYEWGYAYESDWFTVTENTNGSLTITAGINATGDDREGTVTFTAGDGAANTAVATLTITQESFDPASLVLEYTITSGDTTMQLPIGKGTIDCTVDWGDGETETISSGWPSHTYSDAGTYYVSISGTMEWLNSGSVKSGRECLTAVIQWGDLGVTDMGEAFGYCSNLASIPDGPGPFENVGDFSVAFLDCTSLVTVPVDIFSNCASVVDFSGVFSGCTNLTVAPSFEGLSKVTYFDSVFYDCTSLTSLPENMFSGCTASSTYFENAFQYCTSLTTVPVNIFSGCPSIILCRYAFSGCSSVSGESPYDEIMVDGETVKVHLYERENYPDYYTKPVETYWCFENSSFSDYDDIPEEWK